MPRSWFLFASLAAGVMLPNVSRADEPIDLVRGLRENGLPDLALEYLGELGKKNPPPATLAVIPLERARAKLELAADESEEAKRNSLVTEARADFDKFLKDNGTHPRRAEASLSLARLVSVQAKGMISKASKAEGDQKKKELLAARPVLEDGAKRFADAAKEFAKKVDDANLTPQQKKVLKDDLYQARLDEAINMLRIADTYTKDGASAPELVARGKAITDAQGLFTKLSAEDQNHPTCWVAQAWVGECEREKEAFGDAQKRFDSVKATGARNPSLAGAAARQARFFEAKSEFLKSYGDNNKVAAFRKAQGLLESWLTEMGSRANPTPEMSAARFYLANAKYQQALAQIKTDPKSNQLILNDSARGLFQSAERDFRKLLDPENDYTSRAGETRTQIIRSLLGDTSKLDPAKLNDFDTCLMAAQVQIYKTVKEAKDEKETVTAAKQTVALYERLSQLPIPKDSAKEFQDAQANLAYAYILAENPYQAGILGEHLARTLRSPATASRAGMYAIMAYRQAAGKVDPSDAETRRRDENRAVEVGMFLDKQFPTDPATDNARIEIMQQLFQSRRLEEGYRLMTRVPSTSPVVQNARLLQSITAMELLRKPKEGEVGLPVDQKAKIFQETLSNLEALPMLPATTSRGEARLSVLNALQVVELNSINDPPNLTKMEQGIAVAKKKLDGFTALPPDEKKELEMRVEFARTRTLYGQALVAFKEKKYTEAVAKVAPILQDAREKGSLFKPEMQGETANFAKRIDTVRKEVIGLAMTARVREGSVDKVGELLDVLKKMGGSLADSGPTLTTLIEGIRPQIDAYRKEGKNAEADAMVTNIGNILDKVAAEPNVKPPTIIVLAQGLNSIGNHTKAIEFLKKIAAPADPGILKKRYSEVEEKDQLTWVRYRTAQLEMARAYRQSKNFAEADAILKEAANWPSNNDFRKEIAFVLEARAEAEPNAKPAMELWVQSRTKWTEMTTQVYSPLKKLLAGQKDAKSAFIALLDLKQLPPNPRLPKEEKAIRDALREPKPPVWLDELLLPQLKDAAGKPQENPIAVAYIQEMKNRINGLEGTLRPQWLEMFYESIRNSVRANNSLLKTNPMKLNEQLGKIAKQLVELEKANPDIPPTIKLKFAALLEDNPGLKEGYTREMGKAFLKGNIEQ
ncbi:MAG: hypothetical protein ACRC8S_03470 [Fimbriiglobus sp.]